MIKSFIIPKRVITGNFVIAIATVSGYILTILYEWGFCTYFDIPNNLIVPDITTIFFSILLIFFIIQYLYYFGYTIPYVLTNYVKMTAKDSYLFTLILFYFFVSWIQGRLLDLGSVIILVLVGVFVLFGIIYKIYYLYRHKNQLSFKEKLKYYDRDREDNFPLEDNVNKISIVGLWLIVVFGLVFAQGFMNAKGQVSFLVARTHPEKVILREYGNIFIMAPLKKNTKTYTRSFSFVAIGENPKLEFKQEDVGPLTLYQ